MADRPYQWEAVHGGRGYPGIYKALKDGRATLLVLPCGAGKTVVFSRIVEACVLRGKRALILADREELILSAREKLLSTTSLDSFQVGVEMAGERSADHHRVVIASVPSLRKGRLAKFNPSDFGLVVADEAHRALGKQYHNIIDYFSEAKLLGVTATPFRLDGKSLKKVFGEEPAYVYELADAVRDGYLVRPIGRMINAGDAIDLSAVGRTAGDFNKEDLSAALERNTAVALVAKATVDEAGDRPTLTFTVSVAQAHAVAEHMNIYMRQLGRRPSALALDGDASHELRREVKRRFESGDIQHLVNCELYTYGVDIPSIACVSLARPTESLVLMAQMVGRCMRLLGATIEESVAAGKEDSLILDFVGAGAKGRQKCVFDVLDGNADEEVRKRVIKRAEKGPVDALAQLELIPKEIIEEQRRRALADVQYRTIAMADPFAVLGVRPRAGRYGGRPATQKQLERLARHKIPGAAEQLARSLGPPGPRMNEFIDFGQAEQILNAIGKRFREGKCSVRMASILVKHGLNPDAPHDVAMWALDQIKANRWKPTQEVMEHPELRVKG